MTDGERAGTVYYDRSTRLTFTLPSPGFSVQVQGPWEVIAGRFVVNRDLWIVVEPTDSVYRKPDPEGLCAALNRIYTATPAAPAPTSDESPTSS